jgi:hypothetical protein
MSKLMEKKSRFSDEYLQKKRQQLGTGASLLQSAVQAGVDPRTVEYFRAETEKNVDKVVSGTSLGRLMIFADLMNKGVGKDLQKRLESEMGKVSTMKAIRQRREDQTKETVAKMSRKRGKVSLLSSPAGGAGFFGRYFS